MRALAVFGAKGKKVRAPDEWVAALLVRARACLAAGGGSATTATNSGSSRESDVGGSSSGGGEESDVRALAVELLVGVAELGAAPGTPLLAAALTAILGVPYSQTVAAPTRITHARALGGSSGQQEAAAAAQPRGAGLISRSISSSGGPTDAAPSATAADAAIHPASAEWLAARPRAAARLLLALSSFWRASGDECAWLRRNSRAVGALVAVAGGQLAAADPGCLAQLLQAVAAMRLHPGAAWLDAHEARALALLPALRPAALQGLVAWYQELQRRPSAQLLEAAARGAAAAAEEQRAARAREAREAARREVQRQRARVLKVQQLGGRGVARVGRVERGKAADPLQRRQQQREEEEERRGARVAAE